MRCPVACIASLLVSALGVTQLPADGFTSVHVFGDSLSTTEDSPEPVQYFFGGRYCNGRVWIEAVAAWQDLPYVPAQNDSTFGNDIENVETALTTYTAPADAGTALYALWVSGADFANFMFAGSGVPYNGSNLGVWNTFLTNTLDSHEAVVATLYSKGVRNLILPSLPDLSAAPVFGLSAAERTFIKDRVQDFNSGLDARLATLLPTLPGLRVWTPDVFSLIEDVLADPAAFGLQNPSTFDPPFFDYGFLAAFSAGGTPDLATGPGTDYVFWDDLNPSAAVHFVIADLVQNVVCPPAIDSITQVPGGFDLQFSNLPVGRPGSVEGSDDLANWVEDMAITPAATTDTVTLNPVDPMRFFRLDFSSGWVWP